VGDQFVKIVGWIVAPLIALAAIVAPIQTLLPLSLPYLLLLTLVATIAAALVCADALAAWVKPPRPQTGFSAGPANRPSRLAHVASVGALLVLCAAGAAGAGAELHFLALRTKAQSVAGNPVTVFYAPLRRVSQLTIVPHGADLAHCVPFNRSPKDAPSLDLTQTQWVAGDARASLLVKGFVSPQAFALSCGLPERYLPVSTDDADVLVLSEGALWGMYVATAILGGLIWAGSVWRLRLRAR
jgi:hypothetical protein